MMTEFDETRAIGYTEEYNDKLLDLKEQLAKEFWRLVDEELTPRQREVLRMTADGATQIEIARKLNVNQSSVTKSINGNTDYKTGKKKKVYGGANKKLKKLIKEDEKIQDILKQIAQLEEDY